MEIVTITEEQRDNLCAELARLTFEFRKDKSVKCIYFAPYKGLGDISGDVLEVTVVRDTHDNQYFDPIIKRKYNAKYQDQDSIQKLEVKIVVDSDYARKYTTMDLNPSECISSNDLMNSVILYDATGEFTHIKKQTTEEFKKDNSNIYFYYKNLAEICPPIDEFLAKALDVAREKRDTAAVKEFTNTSLFEYIKDM